MGNTALPEGSRARWVRMYGQERATNFGFSIWEMRVYAAGSREDGVSDARADEGKPQQLNDDAAPLDDAGRGTAEKDADDATKVSRTVPATPVPGKGTGKQKPKGLKKGFLL